MEQAHGKLTLHALSEAKRSYRAFKNRCQIEHIAKFRPIFIELLSVDAIQPAGEVETSPDGQIPPQRMLVAEDHANFL